MEVYILHDKFNDMQTCPYGYDKISVYEDKEDAFAEFNRLRIGYLSCISEAGQNREIEIGPDCEDIFEAHGVPFFNIELQVSCCPVIESNSKNLF